MVIVYRWECGEWLIRRDSEVQLLSLVDIDGIKLSYPVPFKGATTFQWEYGGQKVICTQHLIH